MKKQELHSLINLFKNFKEDEKKAFLEAFADLGGFHIDIKNLTIHTNVIYRKHKDCGYKAKIDLPNEWLEKLRITREDSDITMELAKNQIIIKKYYPETDNFDYIDDDFDYSNNEDEDEIEFTDGLNYNDYDEPSEDDYSMDEMDEYEEINSEELLEKLVIKNQNRCNARNLIEKGKKDGVLTLSEILEAFSETELDKDKIENLYETLGNLGIDILDEK